MLLNFLTRNSKIKWSKSCQISPSTFCMKSIYKKYKAKIDLFESFSKYLNMICPTIYWWQCWSQRNTTCNTSVNICRSWNIWTFGIKLFTFVFSFLCAVRCVLWNLRSVMCDVQCALSTMQTEDMTEKLTRL